MTADTHREKASYAAVSPGGPGSPLTPLSQEEAGEAALQVAEGAQL